MNYESPDSPPLGAESLLGGVLGDIVRAHAAGIEAGAELQQRKIDALIAACSAALAYLEGVEAATPQEEFAMCNYAIALLRRALERAK